MVGANLAGALAGGPLRRPQLPGVAARALLSWTLGSSGLDLRALIQPTLNSNGLTSAIWQPSKS